MSDKQHSATSEYHNPIGNDRGPGGDVEGQAADLSHYNTSPREEKNIEKVAGRTEAPAEVKADSGDSAKIRVKDDDAGPK